MAQEAPPHVAEKAAVNPNEGEKSQGGAEVATGANALARFVSVLQEFGFPAGMFPLPSVEEFGYNKKTGAWWLRQKGRYEHEFQVAKELIVYMKDLSGRIQKGKIEDFKGWKMKQAKNKELFLPVSAKEAWLDDPPSGLIHFKNAKGAVASFPVDAFAAGQ